MALSKVDLNGREAGTIWSRKPVADNKTGLLLEVSNTKTGLTSQGRHLLFSKVAFGLHGNWFVAGDQLGNIYHFDINKNKFKLILKAKQACTALVCCISRPSEVLIALSDYTIKCVDIDDCSVVATLSGHEACVHSFSLHSSGRYVLAVSSRDSVLWDLDTFTRRRTLNGGQEVGVQDVFFIPLSNVIVSCFKDDSMHAWDSSDLKYKYQIPPPFGPTPHYRAFAVPQDGRVLVGGGRSNFLHIWTMENRQLLRIVQLPSAIRHVKQLVFFPDSFDGGTSETLGFLGQDGVMRFINIHSCKQLFQIGSEEWGLSSMCVCPVGRHVVAISEAGNILIYDAAVLGKDIRQPPAPLVMLMEDERPTSRTTPKPVKVSNVHTPPAPNRKLTPKSGRAPPVPPHKRSTLAGGKVTQLVPEAKEAGTEDITYTALDKEKLLTVLSGYGEYPAKYRMFIWRCMLQLPENHKAYSSLLDKGTHPSYASLHEKYPMKSRKLLRVLQRALSALAHWVPIFGETQYLPGLVFPFVKMFQNNQLVTFELLATILMNWCGEWFEYFPNPPLNILALVENLLAHHDPHLLQHFIKLDITSQLYAWPLLETLFSEVLSKGEWLRVWDNVISRPPGYILLMVVAYLTTARNTLFKCSQLEDFEYFFRHQNPVDIGAVIRDTNQFRQTTPPELHPERLLDSFVPLTKGTYPVFNKYPKFIVDYQIQERQRIRLEELEYLRERQGALELERMIEQRKQEEGAWYRQQEQLMDAEDQRRKMIEVEDKKLSDQRTRLQALKRELKVKELHVLDAARRRFLDHQQRVRETELKRMDDQVKKKVVHREKETKAVLQDIETRTVELERQKALLEQELLRCEEEMRHRLHTDVSTELHSVELEKSMLERAVEEDAQRERAKLDDAQTKLAKIQARRTNQATVQEARARRDLREIRRDLKLEEVAGKAQKNRLQEKKLEVILDELEKENEVLLRAGTNRSSVNVTSSTNPGGVAGGGDGGGARAPEEGGGAGGKSLRFREGSDSTISKESFVTADSSSMSSLQPPDQQSDVLLTSRRQLLDQQEAAMLSRIRELRIKIASQMSNHSQASHLDSTAGSHLVPSYMDSTTTSHMDTTAGSHASHMTPTPGSHVRHMQSAAMLHASNATRATTAGHATQTYNTATTAHMRQARSTDTFYTASR